MLSKIVTFYSKRNPRERIMLWCSLFAVALVWLSAQTKGYGRLNSEIFELNSKIKLAKTIIAQETIIEQELNDILKTFDPSKTFSSVALQMATEESARKSELEYSISGVSQKDAGRFKINTVTLSCRKGALKNLAAFEWEMRKFEPYITLSRATYEGDSAGNVSAKYEISSFE